MRTLLASLFTLGAVPASSLFLGRHGFTFPIAAAVGVLLTLLVIATSDYGRRAPRRMPLPSSGNRLPVLTHVPTAEAAERMPTVHAGRRRQRESARQTAGV
ncbi:hypothetical protein ASA1KI_40570 [Opitutales bacterium ASA1]|uniref:hypothetical protein n=1 Tax=Congregicoccus parvus TaxID=3081749 RepID=UPI002B2E2F4E|nr:hypothetical protein ASA1KI_40570 [Opitutales bacterium ASA1]